GVEARELEVVGDHEEGAGGDVDEQPEVEADGDRDADPACTGDRGCGKTDEHRVGDPRAKRPPAELVERMRTDPEGEREREQRGAEPLPGHDGGDARADDDVREVPGRVREMKERDVVAPASGPQRIEGRPRCHVFVPEITTPPPRLILRAWTSRIPAARQSSSCAGSG